LKELWTTVTTHLIAVFIQEITNSTADFRKLKYHTIRFIAVCIITVTTFLKKLNTADALVLNDSNLEEALSANSDIQFLSFSRSDLRLSIVGLMNTINCRRFSFMRSRFFIIRNTAAHTAIAISHIGLANNNAFIANQNHLITTIAFFSSQNIETSFTIAPQIVIIKGDNIASHHATAAIVVANLGFSSARLPTFSIKGISFLTTLSTIGIRVVHKTVFNSKKDS